MKLLLSDFRAVRFHDSPVRKIEERPDRICIYLDFALLGPPLEEAAGEKWMLQDCILECSGIQKSEKEEWSDTHAPKPHSDPSRPIEQVQHEQVVAECLELSGVTGSGNWGVWRIAASEYELTWKKKNEFKGWLPTPPNPRRSS